MVNGVFVLINNSFHGMKKFLPRTTKHWSYIICEIDDKLSCLLTIVEIDLEWKRIESC